MFNNLGEHKEGEEVEGTFVILSHHKGAVKSSVSFYICLQARERVELSGETFFLSSLLAY